MSVKRIYRSLALGIAVSLLTACGSGEKPVSASPDRDALTWGVWSGYENFLELASQTYPDIEVELTAYAGANGTGYTWAQMRADDIPDIFTTSQILDRDLAKERLADLSGYAFVNELSTALLDQVAIDGGIYLLPVNNAMYGIYYNKTLMEEKGWQVPADFEELEELCGEIQAEGMIPGVIGTLLTGNTFSAMFNLAKTDWFTTPEGVKWEQDFLTGRATAAGRWEGTMDFAQRYLDIGMFCTDPEQRSNDDMLLDYLGNRKAMFFTGATTAKLTEFPDTGDQLGMMPYISENGSKNIYMYNPSTYIGISKRLTEPGNEEKLERAVKLLSLLYTPEGQGTFITDKNPCILSVLGDARVPEDSLVYDALQAMEEGRAFPMTYVRWENVLSDMGQAYKEWFRGENGMDGAKCITRMDELQSSYLSSQEKVYFCESTDDFTLEETAYLAGKVLGSAAEADAAMIAFTEINKDGFRLKDGITGKLYKGRINAEVVNTIAPGNDGEYTVMTMTGAQAEELAAAGFDIAGDGEPFPYLLVTRGGEKLEADTLYQVAFLKDGYTEETARLYSPEVEKGSMRSFLRSWLEAQKQVSPEGNPWE